MQRDLDFDHALYRASTKMGAVNAEQFSLKRMLCPKDVDHHIGQIVCKHPSYKVFVHILTFSYFIRVLAS